VNVFQLVPQPPAKKSGSAQSQQSQRSAARGRQAHLGQRMRWKSGVSVRRVRGFFSICSGGGVFWSPSHGSMSMVDIVGIPSGLLCGNTTLTMRPFHRECNV